METRNIFTNLYLYHSVWRAAMLPIFLPERDASFWSPLSGPFSFGCCPLFTKELEKARTLPAFPAMRMIRRASFACENQSLFCGPAFPLLPFHVGYTTGYTACLLIHKSLYPRNYAQEAAPQALDQEASSTGRPYVDTFETVPQQGENFGGESEDILHVGEKWMLWPDIFKDGHYQ